MSRIAQRQAEHSPATPNAVTVARLAHHSTKPISYLRVLLEFVREVDVLRNEKVVAISPSAQNELVILQQVVVSTRSLLLRTRTIPQHDVLRL